MVYPENGVNAACRYVGTHSTWGGTQESPEIIGGLINSGVNDNITYLHTKQTRRSQGARDKGKGIASDTV